MSSTNASGPPRALAGRHQQPEPGLADLGQRVLLGRGLGAQRVVAVAVLAPGAPRARRAARASPRSPKNVDEQQRARVALDAARQLRGTRAWSATASRIVRVDHLDRRGLRARARRRWPRSPRRRPRSGRRRTGAPVGSSTSPTVASVIAASVPSRAGHELGEVERRARARRAGSRPTGASGAGSPRRSRARGGAGSPAARGRCAPSSVSACARAARSASLTGPNARASSRRRARRRASCDVVDRRPVDDRVAARRVVADHAAERRPVGGRGVRARTRARARAAARLRSSWTTPGPTRARRAATSISAIASMWREVSSTIPWPAAWPARLVPAPRVSTGTPKRAGGADRGGDVGGVARERHQQRRARVHARVARVEVARVVVGADVAPQLPRQFLLDRQGAERSP